MKHAEGGGRRARRERRGKEGKEVGIEQARTIVFCVSRGLLLRAPGGQKCLPEVSQSPSEHGRARPGA